MGKEYKSEIEQFVINKIREMRKEKKISQAELAYMIDKSPAFIGQVENPNHRAKYNINLLNAIAAALECSIKDFFPDNPME